MLTDELQAERRRENEESLRRFQDEVRHRVAQVSKKRQQIQKTHTVVKVTFIYVICEQNSVKHKKLIKGDGLFGYNKCIACN